MLLKRAMVLAGLIALLSGCGSGSGNYATSTRSEVASLRSTLTAFNGAPQSDVASSIAACKQAKSSLQSAGGLLTVPSTGRYVREGKALQQAYRLASQGFSACAASGKLDYRTLAASATDLTSANIWLQRAQALDHR
ncbi:MAG: hypothetical protein ACRDFX_06600 [Chloroflexota bacterium]